MSSEPARVTKPPEKVLDGLASTVNNVVLKLRGVAGELALGLELVDDEAAEAILAELASAVERARTASALILAAKSSRARRVS